MSFQLCLQFSSLASRSHQARVWSAAAWRGSEATSAPSAPSSASHRGWRGHSPLPRLALRYYGARRRRGDTCMSSHAPAHTLARALKHPSEGIKPWKCGRCWCFSSAGMASPLSFFSTSCCLSRCWKGLGRRESMAQKTPHVSASQWQITVPSPKRRRLKEQNHSVFSLLWKGTWLFGGGGSEEPMVALLTRDGPTSAGLCAVRLGRYAHLCRYTWGGGGGADTHRAQTLTNTVWKCSCTERNHLLNSILQRCLAPASSDFMIAKEKKVK